MKETFEILALRMAKKILDGPRKGWLKEVKQLAEAITADSEPIILPAQVAAVPKPSKSKKIDIHIRWMIRRDMPEVLEIEGHSFCNPWDEEDFIYHLRRRTCIGMIAEFEERVIALMIYELAKSHLYLVNLAVHREFRWCGVGRQLIEKLQSKLSAQRRSKITLECRESNTDGQLFFKTLGFRATAVRKNFYDDSDDDAYVMEFRHEQLSDVQGQLP